MSERDDHVLTESQLNVFGQLLHHGAAEASTALERWIGKQASIAMDAVEQLQLGMASRGFRAPILCEAEAPIAAMHRALVRHCAP